MGINLFLVRCANSTITDLFLFVFTQLIVHYPYPKNDDYFHIMRGEDFVCKMNFRSDNLIRDTLKDIRKYFLIKTTDSYDKVKEFVTSHAEEVKQNEQANEEEEKAGA